MPATADIGPEMTLDEIEQANETARQEQLMGENYDDAVKKIMASLDSAEFGGYVDCSATETPALGQYDVPETHDELVGIAA